MKNCFRNISNFLYLDYFEKIKITIDYDNYRNFDFFMLNQLSVQNFNFLWHLVLYLQLHPVYLSLHRVYCMSFRGLLCSRGGLLSPEISLGKVRNEMNYIVFHCFLHKDNMVFFLFIISMGSRKRFSRIFYLFHCYVSGIRRPYHSFIFTRNLHLGTFSSDTWTYRSNRTTTATLSKSWNEEIGRAEKKPFRFIWETITNA